MHHLFMTIQTAAQLYTDLFQL